MYRIHLHVGGMEIVTYVTMNTLIVYVTYRVSACEFEINSAREISRPDILALLTKLRGALMNIHTRWKQWKIVLRFGFGFDLV